MNSLNLHKNYTFFFNIYYYRHITNKKHSSIERLNISSKITQLVSGDTKT